MKMSTSRIKNYNWFRWAQCG